MPAWLVPYLSVLPQSPQPWDEPWHWGLYHCRRSLLLWQQKNQVAFRAAGGILFQGDSCIPFLSWPILVEYSSALCCGLCGKPNKLRVPRRVLITFLLLGTTASLWAHFTLQKLIPHLRKSPSFHAQGGQQLMAQGHHGTRGLPAQQSWMKSHPWVTLSCALGNVVAFHWRHNVGGLNTSQCSSVQSGYLHFNLKGTDIKVT